MRIQTHVMLTRYARLSLTEIRAMTVQERNQYLHETIELIKLENSSIKPNDA